MTESLAIEGGAPVRSTPFAPWPYFGEDEIDAATNVLRSGCVNYWTGEEGKNFEIEFAAYSGCRYGIALANGTVALELALASLGIGPGDDVIVTCRTFIASASCVVMRGARPVMADIDPESQNVTAETISAALTPQTRAIIAVHLAGWPCDMDSIMNLANQHGIYVIEDCAQAHGAFYKGRPVGSLGHVAAFSFCQDKIMTTAGEGGMLVTNDENIWKKAWAYKDHGKSYEAVYKREHAPGFRWLHESFGTNWRLTEVQSAIGRLQLHKLPAWSDTRRKYSVIYDEMLAEVGGLRIVKPPADILHGYYKYYTFIKSDELAVGWDRDRIVQSLLAEGVPCFSGSCGEIYKEKAFKESELCSEGYFLSTARELAGTSLMFLLHPTLKQQDIYDVCRAVSKVMSHAVR